MGKVVRRELVATLVMEPAPDAHPGAYGTSPSAAAGVGATVLPLRGDPS